MSKVYFIADLHLGHKNICKYRKQFNSPELHDAQIAQNVISVARKRDSLWLLGDCFFTEDSLSHLKEFRRAFKRINFVIGNHDTEGKERQEVINTILKDKLVDTIHSLVKYKGFWLSHAPIHPEELRGKMNIHGHTHSHFINDNRYYNICVEGLCDYFPITLNDIRDRQILKFKGI